MSANLLFEESSDMIVAHVRANIPAALDSLAFQWGDNLVSLQEPRSYFIYEEAKGYQCPAIFVLAEDADFRQAKGANYVNALAYFNVEAMIEDRNAELLTRKAYRYQAALESVLQAEPIVNAERTMKIVVKVVRAGFSPIYTAQDVDQNTPKGMFRKAMWLSCEIEQYEKFSQ